MSKYTSFFFLLFLFIISYPIVAQIKEKDESITYYTKPVTCNPDSLIVIATNRIFDPGTSMGGLGNKIGKAPLSYFVATCIKGQWKIFKAKNIDSAFLHFSNERNFVFFVHGDGKSFASTLKRSMAISALYKVYVVAFDYPSFMPGYSSFRNFYHSRKNIKSSTAYFWQFLQNLEHNFTNPASPFYSSKRTLFAHSLGNYLVMKTIKDRRLEKDSTVWLDNVLLNAGAVKQKKRRKWITNLKKQKRIYVTSNKNDYTLKGAMFITLSKQLGSNLKKPLASNAIYINFTSTAGNQHNCWLDKELLNSPRHFYFFYNEILNGREIPLNDSTYVEKRTDGRGFNLR